MIWMERKRNVKVILVLKHTDDSFVARARDLGLILIPKSVIDHGPRLPSNINRPVRIGCWLVVNVEKCDDKEKENRKCQWRASEWVVRDICYLPTIERGKDGRSLTIRNVSGSIPIMCHLGWLTNYVDT